MVADARPDPAWIAADLLAPGRARRARPGDPDHRRRRLRRAVAAAVERAARRPAARARSPARAGATRRDHRGRPSSTTRAGAGRPRWRPSISSCCGPRPRRWPPRDPPCRRDLPRPLHARGGRRLRRRPQPCAADRRARARFASGLAVFDFLKRTTLLGCDRPRASRELGPAAAGSPRPRAWTAMPGRSSGASAPERRHERRWRTAPDRRDRARQRQHRALEPRGRARAPGRHLRPAGAQLFRLVDGFAGPYRVAAVACARPT